ncbi:ABC transporter ATP-binding protein [soil metagenome]
MTVRFSATLADRDFDVQLSVETGECIAVVGPNGAGKTTLIDLLAGLTRADSGSASIDGDLLFDLPATWLPAHRRPVALLAQDPLLFPHLDVVANVAYGPRSGGLSRGQARSRARQWLGAVGGDDLVGRSSRELSGGESQRVALARALAREPRLLLLDEPMAALDAAVTPTIRATLREQLHGRTTILVTHDVLDALTLADRLVVMQAGRIVEEGPVRRVLEQPRSVFAATLAGLVLLRGSRTAAGIRLADGTELVAGRLDGAPIGSDVTAAVRPADVRIARPGDHRATARSIRALATTIEPRGDLVRVHSHVIAADIPPAEFAALDIATDTPLDFMIAPHAVNVYATVTP